MTFLSAEHSPHDRRQSLPTQLSPDDPAVNTRSGFPQLVEATTPLDAQTDDLLALADILENAGLSPLLLRRSSGRPALAVSAADRESVLDALSMASLHAPWTAHRARREEPLHGDARRAFGRHDFATLFRPRVVPLPDGHPSGLRYGRDTGIRLEFWSFGSDAIVAPRPNALTRREIAAEDVEFTHLELHGRSWRTLRGMFDPLAHEFREPVDIVFSWVDGSSNEFQRKRAERLNAYVVGDGDEHAARFRQVDELRYALRSVHMFAPWIRTIYVATDSPAPWWLVEHPKVRIVRSEEFFADTEVLPTHNSHAVEAQLHRIPGISEHFLYSNDDMFFGRPVAPELFFTSGGLTQYVESDVRIGIGPSRTHRSGHDNAARVNREVLERRFGRVITRDLQHCATPHRRSVMLELEQEFAEEFRRTTAARFRSATDVSVTNSLYHYYATFTGRALPTTVPQTRYIQTTLASGIPQLERLLERRDADMFCLNDGSVPEIPEEVREQVVRDALERYFPVKAPWER